MSPLLTPDQGAPIHRAEPISEQRLARKRIVLSKSAKPRAPRMRTLPSYVLRSKALNDSSLQPSTTQQPDPSTLPQQESIHSGIDTLTGSNDVAANQPLVLDSQVLETDFSHSIPKGTREHSLPESELLEPIAKQVSEPVDVFAQAPACHATPMRSYLQGVQNTLSDANSSTSRQAVSEASSDPGALDPVFPEIATPSQVLDVRAVEEAVIVDERHRHGAESSVHDFLISVSHLDNILMRFLAGEAPACVKVRTKANSDWQYQLTPLGRQLRAVVLAFPHASVEGFAFSPVIELARTTMKSFDFETAFYSLPVKALYPESEFQNVRVVPRCQIGFLAAFTTEFRARAKAKAFRSAMQHAVQETQRARKSMVAAFLRGLGKHKRVCIARVDLEYRNDGAPMPTAEHAAEDMAKLLNNMRHNKLFKDLASYIWKFEVGFLRGPHFHCLFFFDGNNVQNDTYYALATGQYWVDVVTANRGSFHVCNGKVARYRDYGLGMVHVTDVGKLITISKILNYFAKTSQAMRTPGLRSFGTSLPARSSKSKFGRPSRALPDVVERLLMGTCTRDDYVRAIAEWSGKGEEVGYDH